MFTTQDDITTNKDDILRLVEEFYKELRVVNNKIAVNNPIPEVINQGSEDIPEITPIDIENELAKIKDNK